MRKDVCRHYNGCMINDACDKGILYAGFLLNADEQDIEDKIPCMQGEGKNVRNMICPLMSMPTAEELEAQEDELFGGLILITEAMRRIRQANKCSGTIMCTKCGGVLDYRILSGSPTIIRGKCRTVGCLDWVM